MHTIFVDTICRRACRSMRDVMLYAWRETWTKASPKARPV
jgi:hypothetical protein